MTHDDDSKKTLYQIFITSLQIFFTIQDIPAACVTKMQFLIGQLPLSEQMVLGPLFNKLLSAPEDQALQALIAFNTAAFCIYTCNQSECDNLTHLCNQIQNNPDPILKLQLELQFNQNFVSYIKNFRPTGEQAVQNAYFNILAATTIEDLTKATGIWYYTFATNLIQPSMSDFWRNQVTGDAFNLERAEGKDAILAAFLTLIGDLSSALPCHFDSKGCNCGC